MADTLLTSKQAAEQLGIAEPVLRRWRMKGIGPRYIKIGEHRQGTIDRRSVRYRKSAIKKYLTTHGTTQTTAIPMK